MALRSACTTGTCVSEVIGPSSVSATVIEPARVERSAR
jgi:hypothetical protein